MRLLRILCILLFLSSHVYAATDTINTVPSGTASHVTDLQNFLYQEIGDQAFARFGSSIIKGGTHTAAAGLTHTVTALTAYVDGFYVYQAATAHTYSATTDTFVFARADTTSTLTFTGASITYSTNLAFAECANGTAYKEVNAGFAPLMEVITDGTDVTTVTDMRSGAAVLEWYTDFATALTDSVNRTLYITELHVLTANTTIAATNNVVLLGNAKITMGAYNLAINGGFSAPPFEVIDDSGAGTLTWTTKDRIVLGNWTGDSFIKLYDNGILIQTLDSTYGTIDAVRSSFLVKPSAAQTDMNLNGGSAVTVVWGTEVYDVNADFASNTFTAPVAGKYHFDILLVCEDQDVDFTDMNVNLDFSVRSDIKYSLDPANGDVDADRFTLSFSITADMAAAETVSVTVDATGGADQVDISTDALWSGYLVH